jgi:UDP-glucose 4-epimerase
MTRRVLVIGAAGWLGEQLARRLALDPRIEWIVGADAEVPQAYPEGIEFALLPGSSAALTELIEAGRIDTVVEARPPRPTDTRALLAALEATGTPPRTLLFRSSADYYGYDPGGPAFLDEGARPVSANQIVQAESAVWRFAAQHPSTTLTILRLAGQLGSHCGGAHMALLGLPAIPSILGFDPRLQFVEEHDVVSALLHTLERPTRGVFNVAADGVLALSEIGSLLGKPVVPVLPPLGLRRLAGGLRRAGLPAPVGLLDALRLGRGLDNRRLKATGFAYRYTTREALLRLRQRGGRPPPAQRARIVARLLIATPRISLAATSPATLKVAWRWFLPLEGAGPWVDRDSRSGAHGARAPGTSSSGSSSCWCSSSPARS